MYAKQIGIDEAKDKTKDEEEKIAKDIASRKIEEEKERISEGKRVMIKDILKRSTSWTIEELRGFSTKRLERICDAIC